MVRPSNNATPSPALVAVMLPPTLALPVVTAAVTVTLPWLTALFQASCRPTVGCGLKASPAAVELPGWVVTASLTAVPAPRAMEFEVTLVSVPLPKVSV